jgi:hypothetical protein
LVSNSWTATVGQRQLVSNSWTTTVGQRQLDIDSWTATVGQQQLVSDSWTVTVGQAVGQQQLVSELVTNSWTATFGLLYACSIDDFYRMTGQQMLLVLAPIPCVAATIAPLTFLHVSIFAFWKTDNCGTLQCCLLSSRIILQSIYPFTQQCTAIKMSTLVPLQHVIVVEYVSLV